MSQQDLDRREIIGNLISEPRLVDTDNGSVICYCKVASNPRAHRYDSRTKERIPDEQRNRTRSAVDIKITRPALAKKFYEGLAKGDRVWVLGEAMTRPTKKLFWSKQDDCWVPGRIDIDGDGNEQEIMEERQVLLVEEFAKVVVEDGIANRIFV